MLEDPSNGSKTTQYFPRLAASTNVASSSSSETRMQVRPLLTKALMKTSLESTSSFFCSSPFCQNRSKLKQNINRPILSIDRKLTENKNI
uniref:Uncharacterized protein MANES_18G091300 n=1 Tax=Rhizophora mucronata TaxID=61149 RepID=A0A2P2LMB2_RHIMU